MPSKICSFGNCRKHRRKGGRYCRRHHNMKQNQYNRRKRERLAADASVVLSVDDK